MTGAVMSDHIRDFHIEDTGHLFALSLQGKDARTESRTLIANLWIPDLVGRTGRDVATKLFQGILKFILSNTKY